MAKEKRMSDDEILQIVNQEEQDAIDYENSLALRREVLLDYYNAEPFGNETDGQSKFVTSDVADTVIRCADPDHGKTTSTTADHRTGSSLPM